MLEQKLIIFDVDGVLLDSHSLYATIAKRIFQHDTDLRQLHQVITMGGNALFNAVVGANASDLEIAKFRQAQIDLFEPQQHLFPKVRETIQALASKNTLAILSNKPHKIIEEIILKSGIQQHFNMVIGLDSGFGKKPSLGGINHITKLCSLPPVFIGDSHVDYITAKNSNTHFIYCTYGFDNNPINHHHTISNISELITKDVF